MRAKSPLPGLRVADGDRKREREVADVRERVPGVDRERRQDREDLVDEASGAARAGARGAPRSARCGCLARPALRAPCRTSTSARRCRIEHLATRPRRASLPRCRPSGASFEWPAAICCLRPATRTWKNSSRLLAKIARKRTRSSSGLRSSSASYRTRALKSSQDSSRLMYGTAAGAVGRGRRRVAGGRTAVMGGRCLASWAGLLATILPRPR